MEFQCSGPCFSFLSCVFISHRIVLSMLSSNMVLLTLASYSWRMWREFSTLNHTDYFYCYKNNAELRARLLDPFHRPLPSCQFMLWAAVPPLDQWSTLISWKELSQGLPLFPTCILFFFFFQQTYYFQNVLPSVWSAAPMMCCHKAPNSTIDQKVQESLPALPENYLRN